MTGVSTEMLPIYDFRGQLLTLQLAIRYTLKIKNGYILALQAGQHQERLPNLVA